MNPGLFASLAVRSMSAYAKCEKSERIGHVLACLILRGKADVYGIAGKRHGPSRAALFALFGWVRAVSTGELCRALDTAIADIGTIREHLDEIESLSALGNGGAVVRAISVCQRIEGFGAMLRDDALISHRGCDAAHGRCDWSVMVALEHARVVYESALDSVLEVCGSWIVLHGEARRRLAAARTEAADRHRPWRCMSHWVRIVDAFDESMRDRMGDLDGMS